MTSKSTATTSRSAEATAALFLQEFGTADDIRARALAGLQRLREARATHAQREANRLATEREKGDPEVLELQSRATDDKKFSRELAGEIKRVGVGIRGGETSKTTATPSPRATTKPVPRKPKG
jgi:hypothetical protein